MSGGVECLGESNVGLGWWRKCVCVCVWGGYRRFCFYKGLRSRELKEVVVELR